MTRKQLVEGLRALHETDIITSIRITKRNKSVLIQYRSSSAPQTFGQLIITSPNATEQRLQTKPK